MDDNPLMSYENYMYQIDRLHNDINYLKFTTTCIFSILITYVISGVFCNYIK